MTKKLLFPAKPVTMWGFLNPDGKVLLVDRSKRWGWIGVGIKTKWGARTEKYWNEKGYRAIRVRITPLP